MLYHRLISIAILSILTFFHIEDFMWANVSKNEFVVIAVTRFVVIFRETLFFFAFSVVLRYVEYLSFYPLKVTVV